MHSIKSAKTSWCSSWPKLGVSSELLCGIHQAQVVRDCVHDKNSVEKYLCVHGQYVPWWLWLSRDPNPFWTLRRQFQSSSCWNFKQGLWWIQVFRPAHVPWEIFWYGSKPYYLWWTSPSLIVGYLGCSPTIPELYLVLTHSHLSMAQNYRPRKWMDSQSIQPTVWVVTGTLFLSHSHHHQSWIIVNDHQ